MSDQNPQMTPEITASQQQPAVREEAARAPVKQPEQAVPAEGAVLSKKRDGQLEYDESMVMTEPAKADRTKPVTLFGITMPQPIANMTYAAGDAAGKWRFNVLHALPAFIVNNSSNAIGVTQLVGEALYFKSSGVNKFVRDEHRGTWKAFVYPPINVFQGVFKKSAFHIDVKQLWKPQYVAGEVRRFFDLAEASKVDFARDGKLSNRWSARSGFAGMTSMAIAAALPEEKDDPEVTERMAEMAVKHPLGYVAHRVGKGLLFPFKAVTGLAKEVVDHGTDHHIGDGKREFAGLGMTLTGFFSVLAGFRQPRELAGVWKYTPNPWQAIGGAITTYAGSQLLLGLDNQQGWTNYGKTQFGRLLVLPMSIKERFPNKEGWGDPGAKYYFGAQGVFQFKNVVASSIGGAHKLPDGRIVDQKRHRSDSVEKAKIERLQGRIDELDGDNPSSGINSTPKPVVSSVAGAEKAMPERVQAEALQGM